MNKIIRKHDPLTRKHLSDLSFAKEFLKTHFAPELLAKCNLDTLQIESGSFIEDDLATHYSDVCYKVELKNNKGCAFLFCLIEHQSSPERLMPFRILRYQVAIIQKYLDDNKDEEITELPIVASMVFYNGVDSPYPYYLDVAQLFIDYETYCNAPLGKFKLVDLTVTDDSEILKHGKLALMEMVLKHSRDRDFITNALLIDAIKLVYDLGISKELLSGSFSYIMQGWEAAQVKQLIKKVDTEIPDLKEEIMTYAEELKREGEQRGEQKAQQQIARELLKSGVDRNIVATATHLTLEQINAL